MNWTAVTSLVTALTAVGALVFTGLSLNATRNQVVIAQSQSTVAEQGQFTDRYSNAVEQIGQQGTEHLQVRLGGVYALERLAHDSPRDQPTIIEVLSAFIRTTAPISPGTNKFCPRRPISSDVQAALTVLSRRDAAHDSSTHVDLNATCLSGAKNLSNALLGGADLRGADLSGTDLSSKHLSGTHLSNAILRGSDLSGADLMDAGLYGADLTGADLRRVNFSRAFLGVTELISANLTDAILNGADLGGADLTDAILNGADLTGTVHEPATVITSAIKDAQTKGAWW